MSKTNNEMSSCLEKRPVHGKQKQRRRRRTTRRKGKNVRDHFRLV